MNSMKRKRLSPGRRAVTALLIDHYGLPPDHPQVVRSLTAAAAVDPG